MLLCARRPRAEGFAISQESGWPIPSSRSTRNDEYGSNGHAQHGPVPEYADPTRHVHGPTDAVLDDVLKCRGAKPVSGPEQADDGCLHANVTAVRAAPEHDAKPQQ